MKESINKLQKQELREIPIILAFLTAEAFRDNFSIFLKFYEEISKKLYYGVSGQLTGFHKNVINIKYSIL